MMIKIFISSNHFSGMLQSLTIRSADQIITDWKNIHEDFIFLNEARSLYGEHTTKKMAKCLKENQLSYEILQEVFRCSPSSDLFDKKAKDSGVYYKKWRQ